VSVLANILDPIHDTLPPEVWDRPEHLAPKLKEQHKKWISATVTEALTDAGYTHVEEWLSLVLTGSLTTYQYSPESDCDVSLFVDSEHFPEWSRAEMIGIMIDKVDGHLLPGTTYPMQCFVVDTKAFTKENLYQPGLRSGYDLATDEWLVPPDRDRVRDVEREMNIQYVLALEAADKMERLLRYEPHKAEQYWHQIHARRRRDHQAGKGDYSDSNIVYKFLANRGLFPQIAELTGEYIAKTSAFICPHCGGNARVRPYQKYVQCDICGMALGIPGDENLIALDTDAPPPEHPDPWMDNEPGTLTFPEHWAKVARPMDKQVAKFVYDPIDNRLLIGKMAAEEGEVESHFDLAKQAGYNLNNGLLFGQINKAGHVEQFTRPQLTGFGQPSMNQYEADWRLDKALKLALPGVLVNPETPLNPKWERDWTQPEITVLGQRPELDATNQPSTPEGAWVFSNAQAPVLRS
jgi:hypothetical protein